MIPKDGYRYQRVNIKPKVACGGSNRRCSSKNKFQKGPCHARTPGGPSYREAKGGDVAQPTLHSRVFFLSSIITFRKARLIRVWYPRPARWNHASTSASSRNVTGFFTGLYIPAHSSGRYRGSLLDPAEASILGTFCRALARFVTRFRRFILVLLYVHNNTNTITSTMFHVKHSRRTANIGGA